MASVLKVDTIKSLTGNEAMTISEAGVASFATPPILSYPFVAIKFNTESSSSSSLMTNETVERDPYSWWDAANSRILPTIPGWYEVYLEVFGSGTSISLVAPRIYKNGSSYAVTTNRNGAASVDLTMTVSRIIYFNGSTDYVQGNAGVYGTGVSHAGYMSLKLMERDTA